MLAHKSSEGYINDTSLVNTFLKNTGCVVIIGAYIIVSLAWSLLSYLDACKSNQNSIKSYNLPKMEDKLELLGQIKFINTLEKHPK